MTCHALASRVTPGALRATGLGVSYGDVVAIRDLNLALDPGGFLAVTGPSGAGKTSLLWALAAALQPAAGEVRLGNEVLIDREQAAALGIALIPQGNGLAGSLTGTENVLLPLLARGIRPSEARDRAMDALDRVGLLEHGSHLVEELSGGQQQRVAIARALSSRPRVLLADEPTSDLDASSREHVIAALREEADRGAIVVMATHDPEAAEQAAEQLTLTGAGPVV